MSYIIIFFLRPFILEIKLEIQVVVCYFKVVIKSILNFLKIIGSFYEVLIGFNLLNNLQILILKLLPF